MALGWKLHGDGKTMGPDDVVAPDERLSWGKTVGLGAQHVVAMFGATFVFPIVMGLNPQLAIMMSGIATIIFLLIVNGKVPSYLGTSASFVGGVAAIRAQGGDSSEVTGAILVAGIVLAAVGVLIHFMGSSVLHRVLPPVVTGAVVMLIGFNLAPVVAGIYWPQDQWVAILVMVFTIVCAVAFRGFASRIAVFLALIFGFVLSWVLDKTVGMITSPLPGATEATDALPHQLRRRSERRPGSASRPTTMVAADGKEVVGLHTPSFSHCRDPARPARRHRAHRREHRPRQGRRRDDEATTSTRTWAAPSPPTVSARCIASSVGGSPTTTYAENIGVMAATRVYSTAAYYVAAIVAILFGLSPKFGALVASVPGGVLGGITVVLYGMIGLLGAKIWKENGVDFGNPINLVPIAAGIIIGIGNVELEDHRRLHARRYRAGHDRRHRRLAPRPGDRAARAAISSRDSARHDDLPRRGRG